jgi:hypothetical protein
MPPPFRNGTITLSYPVGRPTRQSAVADPPDAVIPDTAERCYPAQPIKRRPHAAGGATPPSADTHSR